MTSSRHAEGSASFWGVLHTEFGSQCCKYAALTEPPAPKIHVHTPNMANAFWGYNNIEDYRKWRQILEWIIDYNSARRYSASDNHQEALHKLMLFLGVFWFSKLLLNVTLIT